MESIFNTIRSWDFSVYLRIHNFTESNILLFDLSYFFARFGIVFFFLAFIYLIWNKKINALICSGFAALIAGGVDLLIYILWKRPRPFVAHADISVPDISKLNVDISSFPSSHTYIAFAIATSVFLYGHRKLGILLFVLAIAVAVSRVGTGLHYPSDIIGGALLGIASGIVACLIVHHSERHWE